MQTKHTPGPWYADESGGIWRRPPSELYENGGTVAGDKPIAYVNKGWFEKHKAPFPKGANARLIAAAPDLLSVALAVDDLAERIDHEPDSALGELVARARAAIAKATGAEA